MKVIFWGLLERFLKELSFIGALIVKAVWMGWDIYLHNSSENPQATNIKMIGVSQQCFLLFSG
jgi:hypothetical protein